jgi:hypothetical protein
MNDTNIKTILNKILTTSEFESMKEIKNEEKYSQISFSEELLKHYELARSEIDLIVNVICLNNICFENICFTKGHIYKIHNIHQNGVCIIGGEEDSNFQEEYNDDEDEENDSDHIFESKNSHIFAPIEVLQKFFNIYINDEQKNAIENLIQDVQVMNFEKLEKLTRKFLKVHEFQIGDKVKCKDGMNIIRGRNKFCIVTKVLNDEEIEVAFLDDDNDLLVYTFDSRRFELMT